MRPERGSLREPEFHAVTIITMREAKTVPRFVARYSSAIIKRGHVEPGIIVANRVTLAFVRAVQRVAGGQSDGVRRALPMPGVAAIGRVILIPDDRIRERILR